MLLKKAINPQLVKKIARWSSDMLKFGTGGLTKREYLQFNKSRLTQFGQLPFGQIPQALKYSRPTQLVKLNNGAKVCVETLNSSVSAAGTRYENLQNSGVGLFATQLTRYGTNKRTIQQIKKDINAIGGQFNTESDRQIIRFTLSYKSGKDSQAIELLEDLVFNSSNKSEHVQALKEILLKRVSQINNPQKLIQQNVHFTSFRDNYMGQPSTGIKQNYALLTPEMIQQFKKNYFVGTNIVISAAGKINAQQLSKNVKICQSLPNTVINADNKPIYTPSIMMMRDDQIKNTSVGIGLLAPSMKDPDWFSMHLVCAIMGEYRVDKHTISHLNAPYLQYNKMHQFLGDFPDIILHKCYYKAYSDTGLLINFLHGNEVYNYQMTFGSQSILTEFASFINQAQIFRGRANVFNNLLNNNCSSTISAQNAMQALHWDRLCSRTQFAYRISNIDAGKFNRIIGKWFWDKDLTAALYGPLHNIITYHTYSRPYRRSTLGKYGCVYSEVFI